MRLLRLGSTEVKLCDLQDNILYGLPDPGSVSQGKLTYILIDAFPCFFFLVVSLLYFFHIGKAMQQFVINVIKEIN